jgi:hypothetical protein
MPVFKKEKKTPSKTNEEEVDLKVTKGKSEKTKKKIRIGFGRKDKKKSEITSSKDQTKPEIIKSPPEKKSTKLEQIIEEAKDQEQIEVFLEDTPSNEEININEVPKTKKVEEKEWATSKRKVILQKDMKGKPVFLEDTGEKIGTVFDSIFDEKKNLIGYKIKDGKSQSILSFPLDQFDEDKNGLIFVPSWYTKGIKTIEKLEFKDRISPELTWLITDNTVSNEELYRIFVKHDDKVASYIEEAQTLRELLDNRLNIIERERLTLKENLMDLTEKRLIKDIDRREFSEIVMEHRRKVNVLDINIKKCKELLDRLDKTSFGLLSKNMISNIEKNEQKERIEKLDDKVKVVYENEIENPYKDKYFDLKQRYEELQEEHNELRLAVEKLLNKDEF